jgi:putative flippase GtrA
VVAAVGLLVNAALMDAMLRSLALHYLVAQVVATGVVLVSNYTLNRLWTFGSRR